MPAPLPPTEKQFKPGESGNPGGRPASRNRLTAHFLNTLAEDFEANGKQAIVDCRINKPEAYVKVIAALCPKELTLQTPLQDASTDELRALLSLLRAAREADRAGDQAERIAEQTGDLQSLQ